MLKFEAKCYETLYSENLDRNDLNYTKQMN